MSNLRPIIPNEAGIYKWTNLITGMVLVGQTGSTHGFRKRHNDHLTALRYGRHHNGHFQSSFNKHSEEKFVFEVLENLPIGNFTIEEHKPVLTVAEQKWLDYYRLLPGGVFNKAGPADSPNRGVPLSKEIKARISATKTGVKLSDACRRAMSIAQKGRKHSEETKKKMGKSRKGRNHSQQSKDKISKSKTGKKLSTEALAFRKLLAVRGEAHPMYGKPQTEKNRKATSIANSAQIKVTNIDTGEIQNYIGLIAVSNATGATKDQIKKRYGKNPAVKSPFKNFIFERIA